MAEVFWRLDLASSAHVHLKRNLRCVPCRVITFASPWTKVCVTERKVCTHSADFRVEGGFLCHRLVNQHRCASGVLSSLWNGIWDVGAW